MLDLCQGNYIGLSINNTVLRAVAVDIGKKKITTFVEQPVTKAILDGGTFLNPALFKDALAQLVEKSNKKIRCISIALPERYALTRELSFPPITEAEITEAVNWQGRNIFPLPLDEMYLDWKTLTGPDQKKEVFVVALPKKLVDDLVSTLNELKLLPVNIQTSASSLGRLLPDNRGNMQVLIIVNRDGTTATLVENNIAKMTATTAFGGGQEKDMFSETVNTVKRLIDFYQAKNEQQIKINKIWLTGEAVNNDLKNKIAQEIKIAADYLRLPISTSDQKKTLAFSEAVAIALAPVEPPSSVRTVNLLPQHIQKLYDSKTNLDLTKRATGIFLALIFCGFIFSTISYIYLFFQARSLVAQTEQAISKTEALQTTTDGTGESNGTTTMRQLSLNIEKFNRLSPKKETPNTILSNLPVLVPAQMKITAWQYNRDNREFIIEGESSSRDALLSFQKELEKQEEFTRVTIPLGSLEREKVSQFRLTCKLKSNEN